ncbi:MAG TPA: GNAT family N-acetyltransferase [Ramlibacter sp.]|uniref:GNAT family N-acetyltransferase n=1 Tax=Ramlibacter sp. TaxID=1917967 RepID=UPI002D7F0DDE|nr:GNAT family N-acetyltransferase [Ramlibacter sp.]HET8744457.1 GNAT family N-acetyltransferase [Ramlibacter sp.]
MDDVLRIQAQCYSEIVPESRASLRAKVHASPGTCFVAEAAAGVVGYLIAVPVLYPELPALNAPSFEAARDTDTLYIHDLAVADAGRGTGAGQALVRAAMAAAKARGLEKACLVAIQGSVRYWEQFGFEPVAAPPDHAAAKLASYGAAARLMQATL